jgi:hypothetical protein
VSAYRRRACRRGGETYRRRACRRERPQNSYGHDVRRISDTFPLQHSVTLDLEGKPEPIDTPTRPTPIRRHVSPHAPRRYADTFPLQSRRFPSIPR